MDASSARAAPAATCTGPVGGAEYGEQMNPGELPSWTSVLVVVAHPDDESFGLGGLLGAFASAGAVIEVLCLTQGEASTLGADGDDLVATRREELALAARRLGVATTTLLDLPDGELRELAEDRLRQPVRDAVERAHPDGVLVFDPDGGVTGHPDHEAASRAALAVADAHGIPVLGWALPTAVARALNADDGGSFVGHDDLDLTVLVDRARQRRAIEAHASQAVPGSVLWRRLELLGPVEHLRWLGRTGR
ncbi:MAG: PIG-L deacetylase family protein [Terracoccus sp.]